MVIETIFFKNPRLSIWRWSLRKYCWENKVMLEKSLISPHYRSFYTSTFKKKVYLGNNVVWKSDKFFKNPCWSIGWYWENVPSTLLGTLMVPKKIFYLSHRFENHRDLEKICETVEASIFPWCIATDINVWKYFWKFEL